MMVMVVVAAATTIIIYHHNGTKLSSELAFAVVCTWQTINIHKMESVIKPY